MAGVSDQAYFISPVNGPGPGVLVLSSWWGLNDFFKRFADRLADDGYSVLVPDLGFGSVFEDVDEARQHLARADADRLAALTLNSARLLAERTGGNPVAVIGFSMGASLALWASVRIPESIDRVIAFYGTQAIDFDGAIARYQLHLCEHDEMVEDDEAVFMEATMGLAGLEVETHRYPGVGHWFFEDGQSNYDDRAAAAAWDRISGFLKGGR